MPAENPLQAYHLLFNFYHLSPMESVYFTPILFLGDTKLCYRSGTVNLKSLVGKVLLRIKWKFELINAL